MPKASRPRNCYVCESQDRVRMTYMLCSRCQRHFCSDHGVAYMEQCSNCLEAGEETD